MFPAKPLRFRADLVCARSLRGRRRSSERRFFVPSDSARRAGWQASPGGRTPAFGPRRAALGTRTLACCPWHTTPPACELASRPVPMLQSLCLKGACRTTCAKAHTGRLMRTAQADPRVPRPCEPACVRGRSPGKMLRRCAPERSAMAICRFGAFLSVQPWQYIVLMHSRAFSYGSKLPWCIPEGATDGKNAS